MIWAPKIEIGNFSPHNINFGYIYLNCSFTGETAAVNALGQQHQGSDLPSPSNLRAENARENGVKQQCQVAISPDSSNFKTRRDEPLFQPERRHLNNMPRIKFNRPTAQIRLFYDGQPNGKQ